MLVGSRPQLSARQDLEKNPSVSSPFASPPLTRTEVALGEMNHVLQSASEPISLATMAVGSLAFGLGRWATVRSLAQWAPRLWQARPLTAHFSGAVGGLAAETSTFSLFPRVLGSLRGEPVAWDTQSIIHDLSKTGLLLGMLRASGSVGTLFLQSPVANIFGAGTGAFVGPTAMGLGIYGNLWLEEKLGWRSELGTEKRLGDALSTLAQFQAAGTVVHRLLGPGYLAVQNHLHRKVQEIQKPWRDSWPGFGPSPHLAWAGSGPKDLPRLSLPESGAGRWYTEGKEPSEPPAPESIEFKFVPGMKLGHGRYTVLELIGIGGMGEVWKLQDHHLDREVATKIALPKFRKSLQHRFEMEYRLQAHLPREWRVEIYEILEVTKGLRVPIMEFVPGQDLNRFILLLRDSFGTANEIYPIEKRIDIFADICEAIHATHNTGILHRDLKPDNILITHGGFVRILDYGVATRITGARPLPLAASIPPPVAEALDANITQKGQVVGTPGYVAPELAREGGAPSGFDPRQGDVFALGVILFEMATGHHPLGEYAPGNSDLGEPPLVPIRDAHGFTKVHPHRVFDLAWGMKLPSFKDFHPSLDTPLHRRLEKVALQAMSFESGERYQSAQALRHAILMVEPKVRLDHLEELQGETQEIEKQLRDAEPPFRRSKRKSPQDNFRLVQLEQRARFLKETWLEESERLVSHLLALTHREDFPAAQHMIAKISSDQLNDRGSRLHPARRATLMERIRENDVPHFGYTKPVMARALKEGVPIKIQVHPMGQPEKEIEGLRWKITRLDPEKDTYGDETGNLIQGRSITLDPHGALPALEYGYYVFEIEAPGYEITRQPTHLSYERVKKAIEDGKPISFELEMLPEGEMPPDMVFIHRKVGYIGHNYYLDGDTAQANSFPMRTIQIPPIAVSRDPISVRQYKEFIEDRIAQNQIKNQSNGNLLRAGLDEIEALLPKTTLPVEARGNRQKLKGLVQRALIGQKTTFYWHLIRAKKYLGLGPTFSAYLLDPMTHEDAFGEPIHPDHPISAISPEAALAYVRWRSEKEGRSYEMLDADTKEVITRNSFDMRYPWGNGPLTDSYVVTRGAFQDVSRASPQIIGTHPMGQENYRDWSWYGVRDLIGNVREFTSTPGEPDHFCLSGGCVRMYLGANFNPSARYQTHRNAVVDSDGTFRLKLSFAKKK